MAFRSATTNSQTSGVGTITVGLPTGVVAGDIILVCLSAFSATSGTTMSDTPDGFTQVLQQYLNGASPSQWYTCLFWKVATGSEPGTYTFTNSSGSMIGCIQCRAYSGRSSTQFSATSTGADTFTTYTSGYAVSGTGLTAATGDDVVIFYTLVEGGAQTYSFTTPTGFANPVLAQNTSTGTMDPIFGADNVNVVAGATGVIATTPSSTVDTAGHVSSFTVAITQGSASAALMGQACL